MDLIERIKNIAELEGISKSEIIIEEAQFFMREHNGHGCYEVKFFYDEKGLLCSIDLLCKATNIGVKELNQCDRDEFPTSIIYQRGEDFKGDIEAQKERRGKILKKRSRHYEK